MTIDDRGQRPRPDEARIAELEEKRRFFSRGAGIASIVHYAQEQGLIDISWANPRVTELGCGSGSGLLVFRLLGADIAGVDLQKYPHISFFQRSPLIGEIPFFVGTSEEYLKTQPDESHDAVFAFNVESDVWTPEVAEQSFRILKPRGIALITWQDVNLSNERNGRFPTNFPYWPSGDKRQIQIYYPSLGPATGHVIDALFSPEELAKGMLVIDPNVSPQEVTMPDAHLMVAKK
ncbi:MAG: hypothetical protein ACD_37C00359G0006 [uncultured bacterium]|nr:MAG: hypothetical protein ACD_37C00359G0006 [uncultured bacterium]